jgi:hypothetical protein
MPKKKKDPQAETLFSDKHITVDRLPDGEVVCYKNIIGVADPPRLVDDDALAEIAKRERHHNLQLQRLRNVKSAFTIFWAKRHMDEEKDD